MHFHENAVHARRDGRPRQVGHHIPLAAGRGSHAARQLHRMRGVKNNRISHRPHDRKRAHIENQVVVSEGRAAFGDQNIFIAGRLNLPDDVGHVPGRKKLSFLHVHDLRLFRDLHDKIRLPAQKRGHLHHIQDAGRFVNFFKPMHIGKDRRADFFPNVF